MDGGREGGGDEGTSSRSRFQTPIPGILTFRYTPRGPTFTLNGAAPRVALRPWRVRFNFTPGRTLKVFRNLQLMGKSPIRFLLE
jgi:hypothetical protein